MGRRTSGAIVGLEKIGLIQANAATLTTTQTDVDIKLDPNGTGQVFVDSDVTILNQGDLRLSEATSNGSNYIAMQAAASMAANYLITWPSAVAASNGYLLASDTAGNLSWVSPGGGITISDPGASATVHYPLFATNSGSLPTALTAANAKVNLAFVPSIGELSATIGKFPDVVGSSSNSGTLTIRGTSAATKAAASILMTDNVASSSTTTGTLVVTGGVGISGQLTATSITETSSIVFKENVETINNGLDIIKKLVGVTYHRKDTQEDESGLIAEEVYKVIPNLVSLDTNGNPYGIKYTKLVAYLIEAVKTLQLEIENLKVNHGNNSH